MFAAIKSFLNPEPPNDRVIEVRSDSFGSRPVHLREDGLVLYLPPNDISSKKDMKAIFEIVFHKPCTESLHQTYSLYRTEDLEDAEDRFLNLREKLSDFITIAKDMFNTQGLQKICDVLAEHPGWNIAHLAAHFGLYDAFKNSKVNLFLNSTDPHSGISPLQVAITTKNLKTVQALVAANAFLEHLDHNNDTIFHYAAITTKEIIGALCQGTPPKSLNLRNKNGYTPLHIACQADKPDCVRALLLAGADVNKTSMNTSDEEHPPGYVGDYLQNHPKSLNKEDMKSGGTPLHWACSKPVVEALVDMNCNIDSFDFEHRTALHVMVMRNRLECVVALLSRKANINLGDADGNRPIHLAIKHGGHIPIIQCLIIFGADLNIVNNEGHTARHLITKQQDDKILYYLHAVGAKRCPPGIMNCTEGCRPGGTFDGIPPPRPIGPTNRDQLNRMLDVAAMEVASQKNNKEKRKNVHLLCLDGGGIRGLILVEMLLEIEKYLLKPVRECFDWVAGTSTGGILALGIAHGLTLKECLCLYFRIKEKTFVGMRPYASEPLENVLKDTFGADTVMADISHPKIMVTGVLADRKPVELHLFRNFQSPSEILNIKHESSPYELPPPPEEQYIWQVGRATGAAPTYFRAFERFLDGGLIANNPTLDAMTEIHEYNLALRAVKREDECCPVTVVVSLGTGLIPVTQVTDIDVFLPSNIFDGIKLYTGISALGSLLVDQATAADGRVVDRARAWCSTIGVPYFRFTPQLSEEIVMNETSDEKLCKMLWETKVYMHENANVLKELADILNKE